MYKHTLEQEILLMKLGFDEQSDLNIDDYDVEMDEYDLEDLDPTSMWDEDGNHIDNGYNNSVSTVSVDRAGITIENDTSFEGFSI